MDVLKTIRSLVMAVFLSAAPSMVLAATGGPDSFGYSWADSNEPGVDVTLPLQDPGSQFLTLVDEDLRTITFPAGFTFLYYGTSYDSITVSDNGWLSVLGTNPTPAPVNQDIPSPLDPQGVIAFYWMDLDPQSLFILHGTADNQTSYYLQINSYSKISGGRLILDVVLYPSGMIKMVYRLLADPDSVVIGIESPAGDDGLQCIANGVPAPGFSLSSPYAVAFFPPANLDCTAAQTLVCSGTASYRSSSPPTLASNALGYVCSPGLFLGNERVFALTLSEPSNLQASISGFAPRNMALFLLGACTEQFGCYDGGSDAVSQSFLPAGTYYLVVDGAEISDDGAFDLAVECNGVYQQISCGETVAGVTSGASQVSSYSCSAAVFDGPEQYYRVSTPSAGKLEIALSTTQPDLDILLSDDPLFDPFTNPSCSDAADAVIVQAAAPAQPYVIAVEGRAGISGGYELSVRCDDRLDCSAVSDIQCSESVSGDTRGGPTNIAAYSCSPKAFTGPERVYRFSNAFEQPVRISLDDFGAGLELIVLRSCDENDCFQVTQGALNCVTLAQGDYTLVVDGVNGAAGLFSLSIDCGVLIADVDLAALAIDTSNLAWSCSDPVIAGSVDVTVANLGPVPVAGGFSLRVFEDRNLNGLFDSPVVDQELGLVDLAGGLVGREFREVTVPVSGDRLFWYNRIHAMVDPLDAVSEADEENNTFDTGLTCELRPQTGDFNPSLQWAWTGSPLAVGFVHVDSTPMITTLTDDNGDGKFDEEDVPDVVFVAGINPGGFGDGVLVALSGNDGSTLWVVTDPAYRLFASDHVAVADIDGDGKVEIIGKLNGQARLAAFENDGTPKWISDVFTSSTGATGNDGSAASIADLDQDGTPEIIYGRDCFNANGTLRWSGSGASGGPAKTGPVSCIADVDLDGYPEVIAGNTVYRNNGTVLWQNSAIPDGFCGVADFDGDPYPEIVLVAPLQVYLLDQDGSILWGPSPGEGSREGGGPPTIADFDNDCKPEIGVAFNTAYVLFETDGSRKWFVSPTDETSSGVTGSSVFDFDGDGSSEIVYADERKLSVFRGEDGATLFSIANTSHTWTELPTIADIDLDNSAEIVVPANGNMVGVRAYRDDNWVNTRRVWNQHAYHITNVDENGSVPATELNNWDSVNNYRTQVGTDVFLLPDLAPSLLDVECAQLAARIGNGGGTWVQSGAVVDFYDGDPNGTGVLIGTTATSRSLLPGEYEDITVPWGNTISGTYDIHILVDGGNGQAGLVQECREDNNECSASVLLDCEACQITAQAGPNAQICEGETVTLDGNQTFSSACDGLLEYRWSWIGTPGVWSSSPALDVSPAETTAYTLEARCSTEPDCLSQDDVIVSVFAFPLVDAGPDMVVCLGERVLIDGSNTTLSSCNSGLSYQYRILGGPVVRGWSPGSSYTFDADTLGITTYVLEAYCEDRPECLASDEVVIEVEDCSTPVRFAWYEARMDAYSSVRIAWATLSEQDTLGFVILRYNEPGASGQAVAGGLIPAEGPAFLYEVSDSLGGVDPATVRYQIVEMTSAGYGDRTPRFAMDSHPSSRALERRRQTSRSDESGRRR